MSSDIFKKLDDVLAAYAHAQRLPGLAVGVIHDGQPALVRSYGVSDIKTAAPVTPSTLFHMASVSKTFVATAVMHLCEQGRLDIERPLVHYLPNLRIAGDNADIRVRHMLGHTSGVTYTDDSHWGEGPYGDDALEGYVSSLDSLEMVWPAGDRFYYNNTLYEVLGHLIALASGQTFESYIEQNILRPLGMEASTFLMPRRGAADMAEPHSLALDATAAVAGSGVYPYNRMHAPSSTLHSGIEEMLRYGMAYLGRGCSGGARILSEESWNRLFEPRIGLTHRGRPTQMGLTWFINSHLDRTVYSHSGSDEGFNTKISLVPHSNSFAVVLCNCDYANTDALERAILDAVMGIEPGQIQIFPYVDTLRALAQGGISALEDALRGYENNPAFAPMREADLLRVGGAAERAGKQSDAASLYSLALKRFPASASLHGALAACLDALSRREQALEHWRAALKADPGYYDAKRALGLTVRP